MKKLLAVGLLLIAGVSRGVESVAEATYAVAALDTREMRYDGVRKLSSLDEVLPVAYNNRLDWPMGGDGSAAAAMVTMRTMEGDPAAHVSTWTASRCSWTDYFNPDPLPTTPGEATGIWEPDASQLWRIELTDADGQETAVYIDLTESDVTRTPIRFGAISRSSANVEYTGEMVRPEVSVVIDGVTLTEGVDYQVEGGGAEPGVNTLTIRGIGAYGGQRRVQYAIVQALSPTSFTVPALDTREVKVRTVESVDDILPVAWNNAADWPTNGRGDESVTVVFQQMSGSDPADPSAWKPAGAPRTVIEAAGEGTNGVRHLAAALYAATLTDGDAITNTAYFNLTGTEASDPVADFEIANFGKVTLDDAGDPLVIALLPGATAPLTLYGDDDLPAAVLDLGGQSLVGTNGVNGTETTAGTSGGPALILDHLTLASVVNGSLVGGNGGDGNPSGKGSPAIVDETGAAVEVTAGMAAIIQRGRDGSDFRGKYIREMFPEPTYEVTGPDADGVYTVTLQADVIGPVMIPDNLGKVKIDLNGHTITGPNGETGSATEAGTSGQSAIIVYHDGTKSGEPTELALVDGDHDTSADIIGGNGGDGNPPGNGAPAIKVNGDVQTGVTLEVGEDVDIQGGKGGNALGVDADGNGVPGGQGGAGVDGNVKSNDGTITGGAGGNGSNGGATGGNGGNGGAGVTGGVGEGSGTVTDGANGESGQASGGAAWVADGSIVIVGIDIDPAADGKWAVSFTLTLKEGAPAFATWLDNTANAGKIKLAVAASEAGLGEATSVEVSNVRVTGENTATVDCALQDRELNLFKVVIEE